MYVTTGSGSSGKCGGGGKGGGRSSPDIRKLKQGPRRWQWQRERQNSFDEKLTCAYFLCFTKAQATLREPTFPTFPFITWRIVLPEKQKKKCLDEKVTGLLAGPIFLLFLRPPESNRSRRVNQNTCERCFQLFTRIGQRG